VPNAIRWNRDPSVVVIADEKKKFPICRLHAGEKELLAAADNHPV
jgi:hypothetical protein